MKPYLSSCMIINDPAHKTKSFNLQGSTFNKPQFRNCEHSQLQCISAFLTATMNFWVLWDYSAMGENKSNHIELSCSSRNQTSVGFNFRAFHSNSQIKVSCSTTLNNMTIIENLKPRFWSFTNILAHTLRTAQLLYNKIIFFR